MASILDNLPGVPMPISEISRQLREMWRGDEDSKTSAPSEFRASQLNLILHVGWDTSESEAQSLFEAAIQFTQRHPGRILFLAPSEDAGEADVLKGKLFTQCYIGESHREMCCCEAVLLEYASSEPRSLFNQVSVWLESDLPIYHWFHRMPVKAVKNKYLAFVKNSKRILYDSAVESDDYQEIPTPDPWRIRDLADARMLPIKQSIGQVLSTFDPALIVDGLHTIEVRSHKTHRANAHQLRNWLERCLDQTPAFLGTKPSVPFRCCELECEGASLEVEFLYDNAQRFHWKLCASGNEATSTSVLGNRSGTHHASFRPLEPVSVLAEAIFFGR